MPEQLALGTPRLELVPCSLAVAKALSDDVEEGGRLLDARLPKEWPDPELAEFLPFYAKLLRQDPVGFANWGGRVRQLWAATVPCLQAARGEHVSK